MTRDEQARTVRRTGNADYSNDWFLSLAWLIRDRCARALSDVTPWRELYLDGFTPLEAFGRDAENGWKRLTESTP